MFCWCTQCSILNNNWSFEARKYAWNGQYFPIHWIFDCDWVSWAKSFVVSIENRASVQHLISKWFSCMRKNMRIEHSNLIGSFWYKSDKTFSLCRWCNGSKCNEWERKRKKFDETRWTGKMTVIINNSKFMNPNKVKAIKNLKVLSCHFNWRLFLYQINIVRLYAVRKIDSSPRKLNAVLKCLQTGGALNLTNGKRKMFYWHLASDFHVRDFQSWIDWMGHVHFSLCWMSAFQI